MKKIILFVFFVALLGIAVTGFADCGKAGVQREPPAEPPKPPSNPLPDDINPGDEIPPVPLPGIGDGSDDILEGAGTLGLFREPRQQALVAWNGKEQMLFLTTNEQSVAGTRAMISMMPLPGAPISVEKSERAIITKANNLVKKKILEHPQNIGLAGGLSLVFKTEIGVHNIFVWEIDSVDTFRNDINQFIAQTYGKEYSVLVSDEGYKVIEQYIDRGFRYFAFDLVKGDGKAEKTKETIMYHYKSNFAYYPVAISQIGGTGITNIALTMISPGGFNRVGVSIGGMSEDVLRKARRGGVEVDLRLDELHSISPKLANLFANVGRAKGRIFEFTGNIDGKDKNGLPGLNKDVILYSE